MLNKNITGAAKIFQNGQILQGWFFSKDDVNNPVNINIFVNDKHVGKAIADKFRSDIVEKNIHSTGNVGFAFQYHFSEDDSVFLTFDGTETNYVIQEKFDENIEIRKRELCVVHIGMHKTGSSSIQHNLSKIELDDYSYFNLGVENHSIPFYSMFTEFPEKYHIHTRVGRSKDEVINYNKNVKKLFYKHLMENPSKEKFIISGEDISVLSYEALKKLQQFLNRFFYNIEIVAYVRAPVSYMTSSFQQLIKDGNCDFSIDINYPEYRKKFEKFYGLFGEQNVRLIKFSPKEFMNNDVTADFLHLFGIKAQQNEFKKTNDSLSLEAVSLFYMFHITVNKLSLISKDKEKLRIELYEFLKNFGSTKIALDQKIIDEIIRRKSNDIEWIENKMNRKIVDDYVNNSSLTIKTTQDLFSVALNTLRDMDDHNLNELNTIYPFAELLYE